MEGKKSNTTTILTVLLALATIAAVYFGLQHTKDVRKAEAQKTEIDSLIQVRSNLESELNSLNLQFSAITMENDSLKGTVTGMQEALAKKDQQLRWAQRKAATDAKELKEEIEMLRTTKSDLSMLVDSLSQENTSLKANNAELTEQLAVSMEKNTVLEGQVGQLENVNKMLEDRTALLASTSFKASAMQVDVVTRRDKSTIKAGRVDRLKLSFDLVDIPEEYHGEQGLYLTITDANMKPIAEGGEKVRVGMGQQAVVIEPVEKKVVNIGPSQRLEFTYNITEKLEKGFYILSIYADKGLVGSTMYQLI